jgi:hypothetical protein
VRVKSRRDLLPHQHQQDSLRKRAACFDSPFLPWYNMPPSWPSVGTTTQTQNEARWRGRWRRLVGKQGTGDAIIVIHHVGNLDLKTKARMAARHCTLLKS